MIRGGGKTLFCPADLIPTSAHIGLRWNMAYDLLPFENMKTKERVVEDSLRGDWTLVLAQDPAWCTWRAVSGPKGVGVERVE